MKNNKFNLLIALSLIFLSGQSSCQNATEKPTEKFDTIQNSITNPIINDDTLVQRPASLVNDFEHIIDNNSIDTLRFLVGDFEDKTAITIAIVTTPSFAPYTTINEYSVWLGNKWGIGLKEINNGIMVVVSSTQKQVRISTGLGMEQLLSDEMCQKIVSEHMLYYFQQGNYPLGISKGVKEIMRIILLQATPMEFDNIVK